MICGLALLASGQAFAATNTCLSIASAGWNTTTTWDSTTHTCGTVGVPTSADDVTIAHTVTVDANAAAKKLTVNNGAILNFAVNTTPFTLSAGAGGIQNNGTFNATNAGAITSAATNGGTHGLRNTGIFTMGSGTLNTSASAGVGLENDGGSTFTGGAGLITAPSFRNGNSGAASFTVGSGGMTTANYMANNGTIVLNGNLTLSGIIQAGAVTRASSYGNVKKR